uniref:Cingulin n=1 Tax=Hippocampus comes TaxID=109280 RepID=A0A3Q2XNY2_HIPCM
MNTSSSGRRTPVDHGVQIRFINDLHDSRGYGGGHPGSQTKPKSQTSSKYGVAVRVQGIAGQPYVVLKDGKKGDSYGVQLKTQSNSGYNDDEGRGGALRRAQSHGSLLDRDGEGGAKLNGSVGSLSERRHFSSLPQQAPAANHPVNRFDDSRSQGQQRGLSPSQDARANHYASPSSSTHSSPGRSHNVPRSAPARSAHQQPSAGRYVAAETEPRVRVTFMDGAGLFSFKTHFLLCLKVTPDLLLDQSAEMSREEEQIVKTIYSILREGIHLKISLVKPKGSHTRNIFTCRLTQLRIERENAEARARGMEDQLAGLQDELRRENGNKTVKTDVVTLEAELMEVCCVKQKLEETLRQRERELTALKGALKDEVATHDKEIEALREQYNVDVEKLRSSMEQVSQSHAGIEAERLRVNSSVRTLQQQLEDCRDESSHWMEQYHKTRDELPNSKHLVGRDLVQELERRSADLQKAKSEVEKHKTEFDKKVMEIISVKKAHQEQEAELRYEIDRLKNQLQKAKDDFAKVQEKNKKAQLLASNAQSSEAELALHNEVRGLRTELDEAKRKTSRLTQEHRELGQRAEDAEREKEAHKQTINQMEELKRQQERALEKINKEFESLTVSSRGQVQDLKVQLEEQRERTRKEIQEVQRQGSDAQTELDRSHTNVRRLEEELSRQKKELLLACEERDNHQLDKEMLTNRLRHLEAAEEAGKNGLNEKTREIRILEDKLKRLELELEEERSGTEMLTERVSRSRDQIDQLRSELTQERSSKQDLELDKNAMERHLKELRGRVADMEGQSRSSAGASQLESKIQELEERLRTEDREKNSALASQRRLERKLKELNMVMDEERETHTEQKDQLSLKVKALKRQVDEGETELERIDTLRRKAQRDLEEQMELKEALQARVTALETELKRKSKAPMRSALDSSALSSDDDDDSIYDSSTIASILNEGNLQTSSC